MFLLVGYILDLYYLEENYRFKNNTKLDEKVGGLDPEQARDAGSGTSDGFLRTLLSNFLFLREFPKAYGLHHQNDK